MKINLDVLGLIGSVFIFICVLLRDGTNISSLGWFVASITLLRLIFKEI